MALLHMLAEYDEPPFLDSLQAAAPTAAISKLAAMRLCQHAGVCLALGASVNSLNNAVLVDGSQWGLPTRAVEILASQVDV